MKYRILSSLSANTLGRYGFSHYKGRLGGLTKRPFSQTPDPQPSRSAKKEVLPEHTDLDSWKSTHIHQESTRTYREKDFSTYLNKFFEYELPSPAHKKVMLVRHAISEGNTQHLIYGHTDYPLTREGELQAEGISREMTAAKDRFPEIYSSVLERTYATGGISLSLGKNPPQSVIRRDARFNEYDFGPLENVQMNGMDSIEIEVFFMMYGLLLSQDEDRKIQTI